MTNVFYMERNDLDYELERSAEILESIGTSCSSINCTSVIRGKGFNCYSVF